MASINPYAEEKEHVLFVYDAPMDFQIHFCFTIKASKFQFISSCLLKWSFDTPSFCLFKFLPNVRGKALCLLGKPAIQQLAISPVYQMCIAPQLANSSTQNLNLPLLILQYRSKFHSVLAKIQAIK